MKITRIDKEGNLYKVAAYINTYLFAELPESQGKLGLTVASEDIYKSGGNPSASMDDSSRDKVLDGMFHGIEQSCGFPSGCKDRFFSGELVVVMKGDGFTMTESSRIPQYLMPAHMAAITDIPSHQA